MSHKRLAALIQEQQEALVADPETSLTHDTILGILTALDKGHVTEGRALHLLRYQAMRLADEPTHAALYRHAAADIQKMQREDHEDEHPSQ